MKKLLFIAISMTIISISIYSKDIPVIKAEIGYKVDFSEEAIENFKKIKEFYKNKTRKNKDELKRIYDSNSRLYDETKDNIWEVYGDSDFSERYEPFPYKILASSYLSNKENINYKPKNLYDDNLFTAWVEGKNDYGIGEYVDFYINKYVDIVPTIDKVIIFNGYIKNEKVFKENARVKKIKMYVDGVYYAELKIEDLNCEQKFDIPTIDYQKIKKGRKKEDMIIRFEIMEVYPGTKYKDTAITEILFYTNQRLCFPATTKITLSDNSEKTIDKLKSGDEILTYNSSAKKFIKTKVVSVAKVPHNNLVEIDFGDKVITSTDDHPYLSENGWKSCKPNGTKNYKGYENVKEMKKGDKIYFIGENEKAELKEVKGIKKVDKKEMCYTITKVENGDNFIADGAVVGVEEIE